MKSNFINAILLSLVLFTILHVSNGKQHKKQQKMHLKVNFYHKTCPSLEKIARKITWRRVKANPNLAAKLLRLQFHDCFVRGCDASILLDSTPGSQAEKQAEPNGSLSGFEVIDEIKAKLEEACPETVSCADIIAAASRDAVSFQFQREMWPVYYGRKDGVVSLASEVYRYLPAATENFTTLQQQFANNGLDIADLVALSGAHTIGVGHCTSISERLFNFTGKGDTDPSINPEYAHILKHKCANYTPATTLEMDPGSSLTFDTHYFRAVKRREGLFQSDAALLNNPISANNARLFENPILFFGQFGISMVKMGEIGVLTRNNGEIRKNCRAIN